MQPDMTRRLKQLRQQAAHLGQLARDLAAATPQRSEGNDTTGWVRVVLGPDGLPTQIQIRDGWRQRLEPERLGAAVLDANADAVQRAMRAWTDQLDNNRWWQRRADVDETAGEETDPVAVDLPDLPSGQVRESTELAENVLEALEATQRQPTAPPTPDEGTDDGRHVTIQIGAGELTGCVIDPGWAAQRDGATISTALSSALRQAVAKRPAASPGAEIDNLLRDALATFASLTMPIKRGGDDDESSQR